MDAAPEGLRSASCECSVTGGRPFTGVTPASASVGGVTLFESGGTGSPPQRDESARAVDGPSPRVRRRRLVAVSAVVAVLAVALLGVVLVVGPERIATGAAGIFGTDVEPPAADLVEVADKAFLTDEARTLLYASKPRIAPLDEVAAACERPADDPPVGCYSRALGILVHVPSDARVADWAVTTLAHELLHAAYDVLGDGELSAIHDLLEAEIARVPADDRVHLQIEGSIAGHEASRETELFAYLGSQVMPEGGFAPALEEVYARYFTDRAALVAVYQRVDGTVRAVYDETLAAFEQLAADEQAAANERGQLTADLEAYETARVEYDADADHYNQLPEAERGRWIATWTARDGTTRSASLGEALVERFAELEAYRVELDARTAALEQSEASAVSRRAEVEAQHADLLALLEAAYPGESFE